MLVINKNQYEYVDTSLRMMKLVDFEVMHQVDHSSVFHNAKENNKRNRIHLNFNIRDLYNYDIKFQSIQFLAKKRELLSDI